MNVPTSPQIIEHEGQPLFVVLPYAQYLALTREAVDDDVAIPWEVSKLARREKKSLMRAWREYLGLTQEAVAARAGISRGAYAQMEAKGAKPRRVTLLKIATALGVRPEQLTE
ncbi:helix-turn-helix domain-containing protein [Desulfolutivibrio sulfoxidireducens]|uniref:helix-turn-helix domain-containing protein n=1 Tax=Desulfolutivibrio sulfoxidireducens TaxID=2773299 RepID=UPI00159D414E|nr:helix-turn-helix transcriptional regulator [Desulfolutivibrio sulfoxidireducens]QLA20477.1 helix-turn-helix domain-containing protein [Desulfolutivibrio sulfoxidireducens]